MKRMMVKKGIVLGLFLMLAAGYISAANSAQNALGSWAYEAPSAPYEYSKGKLIFTKKEGKLEGKIKIGSQEISLKNIKTKGDKVTCGTYVEGEYISIKLTLAKSEFTGTANSPEGVIKLSGKKEK